MNFKDLFEEVNVTLRRLNNIRRWTGYLTEGRYDEISKQALNCVICFILATEVEATGIEIKWERFPKIALYRAFQKAYVNFDTPEHILKDICSKGNMPYEKTFNGVTLDIISEKTSLDTAYWISEGEATFEANIYKAATRIATLLELNEVQKHVNGEYSINYQEIISSMVKYSNIPCFDKLSDSKGDYFKVFRQISRLRNQNRWAAYSYNVECSVLGHLFDTGVFAYLMALEKGEKERKAARYFFMGIFHDVPEAFTRDIPSPIKDKIPGFRELTEKYELEMMEQKVYPYVSEVVKNALKEVMMEGEKNTEFKPLLKGADYLSATCEIWRQYMDSTFAETMVRQGKKFSYDGKIQVTGSAMNLYKEMLNSL